MENTIKNQEISKVVNVLKYVFVIVPIVAGADKFTNLLCNWEQYLNPTMGDILPFSGAVFMKIVGVIEIVAGLIVLKKPIIGGYIVSAWLALIAISLLASLNYLDVAVRDLVMSISALSMAKLSKILK
ncbi:hypothetical protein ACP6L2_02165 [Sphingobacterium lactis]|uniref:hypothetical protein n=1 Tax=Sphingobacterium lactis TaxID=797291 RepID=UPI003F7E9F9E